LAYLNFTSGNELVLSFTLFINTIKKVSGMGNTTGLTVKAREANNEIARSTSLITALTISFFIGLFGFVEGNLILTLVMSGALIGVFANYALLKRLNNYMVATYILLSIGAISMFCVFTFGEENIGLVWPFAWLCVIFLMNRNNEGRFFVLLFFAGCLLLTVLHIWGLLRLPYSTVALVNFFAAQIAFIALMYFYQKATIDYEYHIYYTRKFFDTSIDPFLIVNIQGIICELNESAEQLMHLHSSALIGSALTKYITEPDKITEILKQTLAEGSVRNFPLAVTTRDERIVTDVLLNASLYIAPKTNEQKLFVILRDITEHKKSNEKFIKTFELCPVGICLFRLDNGVILEINDSYLKMIGYQKEEVVGHSSTEIGFINADERHQMRAMFDEKGRLKNNEIEFIRKTGEKIRVLFSVEPIVIDGVQCLISIVDDITGRNQMENKLRERDDQIQTVFNNALQPVIVFNEKGIILRWNPKAVDVFGWAADEAIGKEMALLIMPHKYRNDHFLGVANFLQTGNAPALNKITELSAIRKNGDELPIELSISATVVDSKYLFIAFINDTKERMDAERRKAQLLKELTEANEELGAFTYSVSHDLRAPLRAIEGYTSILRQEYEASFDQAANETMNSIVNNTHKMGHLIDDLLAFSRLGKQPLVKTNLDITSIVKDVLSEFDIPGIHRQITIDIKSLINSPGDRGMIQQVMTNLISNALKYSGKKEKAIIEIGSYPESGYSVYYVKDNGVGFDMMYYDKLFGVFQRLHNYSEYEGTGVGLAIVHRIVTKHGGKVWAESKINDGALFSFSLPST
jgi:PAS domain S-box-containing protein